MTPLDSIKQCIEDKKCFVLQGGAGSGKTETLKNVLEYISENHPNKKVACITHTNLAVGEIKSRVGDKYTISTIHSFLNSIIKDYKKNIFQCIFELFKVEQIERKEIEFYSGNVTEQRKKEHEKYKKVFEKYANKLFTVTTEKIGNPEGKRIYDVDPVTYNTNLNTKIEALNELIKSQIEAKDYNKIQYNETRFNSYNDLTFGHDGLLEIAYQLFSSFPKIGKILQDKFDYIFIDEYQDTNEKIIKIFLEHLLQSDTTVIGLFGDAMQSIYKDGIGDVQNYITDETLEEIIKEDNYRCSVQVVDFINNIRTDGLSQEVQLKHDESTLDERQGNVTFYYSIVDSKPTTYSTQEIKNQYIEKINSLIELAKNNQPNSKFLMLTNKSISIESNFQNLYETFAQRYQEPKEYIDKVLITLQLIDLVELCQSYEKGNFNFILSELKKVGYPIRTIADKQKLKENIEYLLNFTGGAIEAVIYAFENNLIKKSESFDAFLSRRDVFLTSLNNDEYRTFKTNYTSEQNTYTRMTTTGVEIEEERFKELEKELKKEKLFIDLFSPIVTFEEVVNYYNYISEKVEYITMHKTKGSGIENVIVVLDEYFWNEYDFSKIFDTTINDVKKIASQKLFYVACSRTKKNLTCIKLITQDEEVLINQFFSNATAVSL
ncbi:UvrD/REP helicase domain-containing protein [Arcobacter venerupis]|uniref:UvrD/REP helicase domain-containing protein n=3 Tax=Arcobacter venerupis TaxID=1054033 RepID=A0AAE7E4Y4_9BACT|nr:UvrD-helicase domain-containing protein [Arcobacter venerupis]QKF67914.1 UvrD/REP helicase domain-containing protein [Arcobacter venerupis]